MTKDAGTSRRISKRILWLERCVVLCILVVVGEKCALAGDPAPPPGRARPEPPQAVTSSNEAKKPIPSFVPQGKTAPEPGKEKSAGSTEANRSLELGREPKTRNPDIDAGKSSDEIATASDARARKFMANEASKDITANGKRTATTERNASETNLASSEARAEELRRNSLRESNGDPPRPDDKLAERVADVPANEAIVRSSNRANEVAPGKVSDDTNNQRLTKRATVDILATDPTAQTSASDRRSKSKADLAAEFNLTGERTLTAQSGGKKAEFSLTADKTRSNRNDFDLRVNSSSRKSEESGNSKPVEDNPAPQKLAAEKKDNKLAEDNTTTQKLAAEKKDNKLAEDNTTTQKLAAEKKDNKLAEDNTTAQKLAAEKKDNKLAEDNTTAQKKLAAEKKDNKLAEDNTTAQKLAEKKDDKPVERKRSTSSVDDTVTQKKDARFADEQRIDNDRPTQRDSTDDAPGHRRAQQIAEGHAFKHAAEFGFKTPAELAEHIENVLSHPSAVRVLPRGRTAYWDDASRTIVILDPSNVDGGTVFKTKNRTKFDAL